MGGPSGSCWTLSIILFCYRNFTRSNGGTHFTMTKAQRTRQLNRTNCVASTLKSIILWTPCPRSIVLLFVELKQCCYCFAMWVVSPSLHEYWNYSVGFRIQCFSFLANRLCEALPSCRYEVDPIQSNFKLKSVP